MNLNPSLTHVFSKETKVFKSRLSLILQNNIYLPSPGKAIRKKCADELTFIECPIQQNIKSILGSNICYPNVWL